MMGLAQVTPQGETRKPSLRPAATLSNHAPRPAPRSGAPPVRVRGAVDVRRRRPGRGVVRAVGTGGGRGAAPGRRRGGAAGLAPTAAVGVAGDAAGPGGRVRA